MRCKAHVRFGGRAGETDLLKDRHRALVRSRTDREGETLYLEADHRRHAVVEDVIRDLKYGVGLNHLPSGRFAANAAWIVLNAVAHDLGRWVRRIGLGEQSAPMTTKTLRTRVLSLPERMTSSGGRRQLHLPTDWPWEEQFSCRLANLLAIRLQGTPIRARPVSSGRRPAPLPGVRERGSSPAP
jgi:hypothetical protein